MTAKTATHSLVGQFFHSIDKQSGKVEWQGVVIGNPEPGFYYVQLFEWEAGEESVRRVVPFSDMIPWLFYEDSDAMNFSYAEGFAGPGSVYQDKK